MRTKSVPKTIDLRNTPTDSRLIINDDNLEKISNNFWMLGQILQYSGNWEFLLDEKILRHNRN